jgi:thiol-disulfide isomerase/thioredoxin
MSSTESPVPSAPQTPPRRRRWLRWLAEVGIFLLIVLAIQWWQTRDVPGGPAPDFETLFADGGRGSLAAWRAAHPGRVTALYFWAEWCPICKAQEGSVEALRGEWPVLTVAMQSGDPPAVAKVLAERALPWTTAVDTDGRIAARYGLRGVPALVVIGPDGNMRAVAVGYTTGIGMRLRLWWAQLTA